MYRELADSADVSAKQVATVFSGLTDMIKYDLGKKGPGKFTVPGLMKIVVIRKPATKARKGINPFTGEETMFKAKPARNVVKVRALKALKDMV
jgi:nucleoid DNA-binding protein